MNDPVKKDLEVKLLGVAVVIVIGLVLFNATMNIAALTQRGEIMRAIDEVRIKLDRAQLDRDIMRGQLLKDLSELKALQIKEVKNEK